MKIAFRVDASARIGGGHVMRCLTLADELKARGAETSFIAAAIPPVLAERVRAAGHALHIIEPPEGLERTGDDWENHSLSANDQAADARRTVGMIGQSTDWIVVDHYLLGAEWHRQARPATQRLMVIDDLANRRLDCDLLLDQTLGRAASDYAPLAPEGTTMLLGAGYALLRPEFARERPAALARRRAAGPVRRILLSLGTTDLGGVTGEVLAATLAVSGACPIDVVLGAGASSLGRVRAIAADHPQVEYHVEAPNMAELMREADLAIGAAGTTSWERCCLGLPSLTLTLAANQSSVAIALAKAGASSATKRATVAGDLAELIENQTTLARMSAAAFAIVDGLGGSRVAERLTKPIEDDVRGALTLRPAKPTDSEQLWLWRNDPLTRATSRSIEPIGWSEHQRWFVATLESGTRELYIAKLGDERVGTVRFDSAADEHEISINIRPDRRGAGIGSAVLRLACERFEAKHASAQIVAAVHDANPASQRTFERCGFVGEGGYDGPFRRYVRHSPVDRSRKSA